MINRFFFLFGILILMVSCNDEDQQSEVDQIKLLTNGTWVLNNPSNEEFLILFQDMTYVIAGFTNAPIGSPVEHVKITQVLGEWQLENNEITFLTNFLEIDDPNKIIDEGEVIEGQPIGHFYGEVITWVNGKPIRTGPNYDPDYEPTSLIILELTANSLILEGSSKTLEYTKEN